MLAVPVPNRELHWTQSAKLPLTAQITSCHGERGTTALSIIDLTKSCGDSIQQLRPSRSLTSDAQVENLYGPASMTAILLWALKFDAITAWESIEHIKEDDLPMVASNVQAHLAPGGIWILSITNQEDIVGGVRLHQTVRGGF
jgi:hypothetical protein